MKRNRMWLAAAAALMPGLAFAHPGHDMAQGFMSGLQHPWTGIDHIAAMLAAGLWASRLGDRSILALLLATVAGLIAGTTLGVLQGSLSLAEQVTAASAIVLGLVVVAARTPRVPVAAVLVGSFGLFHGYVHAVESPQQYWQPTFSGGFIASMLILQTLGFALGTLLRRHALITRSAGACCAVAGVVALSLLR